MGLMGMVVGAWAAGAARLTYLTIPVGDNGWLD